MKVLVLGWSGMLGVSLVKNLQRNGFDIVTMAQDQGDFVFDIANGVRLEKLLKDVNPDVIINTIAIVSLGMCEQDPGYAYCVNSRPASIIAEYCRTYKAYFIQISTDHYYSGNSTKKHQEHDNITLLNEYARTKFIAERFALLDPQALVVRTNIVGFRGQQEKFTFVEWAINSLKKHDRMVLFDDFFTSSIDVKSFSKLLCQIIKKPVRLTGVINIASSQVASKKEFILELASIFGLDATGTKAGSLYGASYQGVRRADSLGLDVTKIEQFLKCSMPNLKMVVANLAEEYKEFMHEV